MPGTSDAGSKNRRLSSAYYIHMFIHAIPWHVLWLTKYELSQYMGKALLAHFFTPKGRPSARLLGPTKGMTVQIIADWQLQFKYIEPKYMSRVEVLN